MQEGLTPSQREAVIMYFLESKTQRQIAERLGISQQAVSAHLFGKMRRGRRVGLGVDMPPLRGCADAPGR